MRRGTAIAAASLALAAIVALAWRAGAIPWLDADDRGGCDGAKPPPLLDAAGGAEGKPAGLAARPASGDAMPVASSPSTAATAAGERTGIAYRALVVDEEGRPLRGAVLRLDATQRQQVTIV